VIETLCGLPFGLAGRGCDISRSPMVGSLGRGFWMASRMSSGFLCLASLSLLLLSLAFSRPAGFGSPTAGATLERVPVA
jgi:hypothetical protein